MTAAELLSGVARLKVLIVGDICLDHWCYYDPALSVPSAETRIPRLAITSSERTPGAAGTVANNLKSLGAAEVAVLGLVGDDGHGYELLQALHRRQISTELIVHHKSLPTFTYTKLINSSTGVEDHPRVDFIYTADIPESVDESISTLLRQVARRYDLICVSDQAETDRGGVVTSRVRRILAELGQAGQLIWVDSRRRIECFRHAILKANEEEARDALARAKVSTLGEIQRANHAGAVFVTRGGDGIDVYCKRGMLAVPTRRVSDPVDICGAGDSFTAGAACALASGATLEHAAILGHLVASVTIMKKGTGSASPSELLAAEHALRPGRRTPLAESPNDELTR